MPTDTYIFTEAGENIGYGHYTRCRAIQNYFLNQNDNCKLFVNTISPELKGDQNQKIIDWIDDIDEILPNIDKSTKIIIDSYLANHQIYKKLFDKCRFLLAIDDYNRIVYPAHLVINPNINFDIRDYSNQNAKVKGGLEYIILRNDFIDKKSFFKVNHNLEKILITLGGSDFRNLLSTLLNIFYDYEYKILVVTGTEDYKIKISNSHKSKNYSLYGYLSASEMVSKMLECDLAISGCGQTLHELSYLGIPTIGICIDKDQKDNMYSYINKNFLIKDIFWNQTNIVDEIKNLVTYIINYETRNKISNLARKINDGKGIQRIYSLINQKN